MMDGLHHIGVMTADLERSMEFYKTIGLTATMTKDLPNGTRLAFMRAGSAVIELVKPADASSLAQRGAGIVDHIAFEVKDIDAVISRLREKNIAFAAEKSGDVALFARGSKNIFFDGPNGEKLELFEEL